MNPPFEFALAIALPIAAVYAVVGGGRLLRWMSEHPAARPAPPVPLHQVRANLVRLRADLEATENRTDLVAKNTRLRAVRAAYVDALYDACLRLEASPPPDAAGRQASVRRSDIYRLESALRERGIDVRETAAS